MVRHASITPAQLVTVLPAPILRVVLPVILTSKFSMAYAYAAFSTAKYVPAPHALSALQDIL